MDKTLIRTKQETYSRKDIGEMVLHVSYNLGLLPLGNWSETTLSTLDWLCKNVGEA